MTEHNPLLRIPAPDCCLCPDRFCRDLADGRTVRLPNARTESVSPTSIQACQTRISVLDKAWTELQEIGEMEEKSGNKRPLYLGC